MDRVPKRKTFSLAELLAFCNEGLDEEFHVSRDSLRRWIEGEEKMIVPLLDFTPQRFSYREAVKAKVAAFLLAQRKKEGLGKKLTREIRKAVKRLGELLSGAGNLLESHRGLLIYDEGIRVVFETPRFRMEGSTGQLLLSFPRETSDDQGKEGLFRALGRAG